MRKAKYAALVFGGVSTCIFGGLLGVYATSPVVSTVAPKNDVQNIYDVESDELSNVAAVTSIRTTPVTTTSNTYRSVSYTTAAADYEVATTATTTASTRISYTYSASVKLGSKAPFVASNYSDAPVSSTVQTTTTTNAWAYAVTTVKTTTITDSYEYVEPTTEFATVPVSTEAVQATTFIITTPDYDFTTEPETTAPIVEEVVTPAVTDAVLPITDEEFIILCNAVAHEAGCYWIDEYDKAKVVEVIMNRVNSPLYPNTILGVLTQPYQFSGSSSYVYLGSYSSHVSDSVISAVQLYFSEPSSFAHGYFGFYGDGYRNYFY